MYDAEQRTVTTTVDPIAEMRYSLDIKREILNAKGLILNAVEDALQRRAVEGFYQRRNPLPFEPTSDADPLRERVLELLRQMVYSSNSPY